MGRRIFVLVVVAGLGCAAKSASTPDAQVDAGRVDAEARVTLPVAPVLAQVVGASADAGKRVFAKTCASCHGDDAKGAGPKAKDLPLAPTDLTGVDYLCRSTVSDAKAVPSDDDIESTLTHGTHQGLREIAALDGTQRRSLTLYLKTLNREFVRAAQPLSWVAPESPDDAAGRQRGRTLFLAFGCWRCHGVNGEGGGEALKLIRYNGRPIGAITPLYAHGARRCGNEPTSVYRRVALGMSTLMPAYERFAAYIWRPQKSPEEWGKGTQGRVPAAESHAVHDFYAGLPTKADVMALGEKARRERAGAFVWDLVHYVRALESPHPPK